MSESGNQGEVASRSRTDMDASDDNGGVAHGGVRRKEVKVAANLTKGGSVGRLQQDSLMGSQGQAKDRRYDTLIGTNGKWQRGVGIRMRDGIGGSIHR